MGQLVAEDNLKKHAELEKEMILNLKKTIKKIDEPSTKKILEGMIEEENRHHKIIMDMSNGFMIWILEPRLIFYIAKVKIDAIVQLKIRLFRKTPI